METLQESDDLYIAEFSWNISLPDDDNVDSDNIEEIEEAEENIRGRGTGTGRTRGKPRGSNRGRGRGNNKW